jgi:hypothetical protein
MRMLLKVQLCTKTANELSKKGTLGSTIKSILDEQKPEAAYFIEFEGNRTGLLFVHLKDASEIPRFAEPWFLAFNARVEFKPAMVPADLEAAGPSIAAAVKKFG